MKFWADHETDEDGRITSPNRVAIRHCAAAFVAIGLVYIFFLLRFRNLAPYFDYKWLVGTPVFIVAVIFGYAYLGAWIGKRAAINVISVFLLLVIIGLYVYMDALSGAA